jgi:hypothetical protein
MTIIPFPLPPGAEGRLLLHHLLEHGDIVGTDATGRTIIQLAVDNQVLENLMTFDADAADRDDEGDDEPEHRCTTHPTLAGDAHRCRRRSAAMCLR